MTKLEITVGIGLDWLGNSISLDRAQAAVNQLRTLALGLWGGVSVVWGEGAWRDNKGVDYIERNVTFVIISSDAKLLGPSADLVDEFIRRVKQELDQATVMVTRQVVQMEII